MSVSQETKTATTRSFAKSIVDGSQESFKSAVDSKAKDNTLAIATALVNFGKIESPEDYLVFADLTARLNSAYKSAISKTVKVNNNAELRERAQVQSMVRIYGTEKTRELLETKESRVASKLAILDEVTK